MSKYDYLEILVQTWKKKAKRSFGNKPSVYRFCANELDEWIVNEYHPSVLVKSWRDNAQQSAGDIPDVLQFCADQLEEKIQNHDTHQMKDLEGVNVHE